ncbi:hypothetical protein D9619_012187 [Psilocybe cf. subviscida]|uniref:Uncharacterized protein n=1 Tax=Psilocybe cf. subviscida TaxID=2480587 RepID=A0A8H5B7E2_9AGAR|nr:hypothetical protein D9619_012187 [Psilocybe cf. subviscida]
MYFRSLAVFAFAACATFVSASPTPSSLELVAARASDELALVMRDVALAAPAAPSAPATPGAPAAPAALPAPAKVLQDMTAKLTPMVENLKAAVADKTALKQAEIVGHLNDMVTTLTAAHGELQGMATDPAGFATNPLDLGIISSILGTFLQLIFPVLALVLQVVTGTPLASVVLPLLLTVAGLLQTVLLLVLSHLPGLLGLLSPVLVILLPILSTFQLGQLLGVIPGLTL